tara:strand:- start:399 stop:680 length:282 start_codon:yes stop_codon:yes gene_type:complete
MNRERKHAILMEINRQRQCIKEIQEAIELIWEAKNKVEYALEYHRNKHHFDAYDCYGFNELLNTGNPHNAGLKDIIKTSLEHIDELKSELENE